MRAVECKPVSDYDNGLRTSSVSLEDNHEEADGNWNNVDSISLGNFKSANAKDESNPNWHDKNLSNVWFNNFIK